MLHTLPQGVEAHQATAANLDRLKLVRVDQAVDRPCRKAEHLSQPGFPVAAVVGQGLARPFAGNQHPAPGVAEVIAAVRFPLAGTGDQAAPGVSGLDAVAQPVRAGRRARLVAERLGKPVLVVRYLVR